MTPRRAPAREPWRRTLKWGGLAALCLLLGAATTVGVAWMCARRQPPALRPWVQASVVLESGRTRWEIMDRQGPGVRLRSVSAAPSRGLGGSSHDYLIANEDRFDGDIRATDSYIARLEPGEKRLRDLYRDAIWLLPAAGLLDTAPELLETPIGQLALRGGWGHVPHPPPPGFSAPTPVNRAWSIAAGWPMTAVWGWETTTFGSLAPLDEGGLIGAAPTGGGVAGPPARLPRLPLWPGFLVNTLFYAVPWWALLITPGGIKRWRRKRRGACLACGYDLRGLGDAAVCPECGRGERAAARS